MGLVQYIFGVEKPFQSIQTAECQRQCMGDILGKGKTKYFSLSHSVFGFRPKAQGLMQKLKIFPLSIA